MNVSKADDWEVAIDKAVQLWGKVDILVNNAGTSYKNKVRNTKSPMDGLRARARAVTNNRMSPEHARRGGGRV